MPPESPPVQLRGLLAECREDGLDFESAWELCTGRMVPLPDGTRGLVGGQLRWPHDTTHRKEWKDILASPASRCVWRAAYYREPVTTTDQVLSSLAVVA